MHAHTYTLTHASPDDCKVTQLALQNERCGSINCQILCHVHACVLVCAHMHACIMMPQLSMCIRDTSMSSSACACAYIYTHNIIHT